MDYIGDESILNEELQKKIYVKWKIFKYSLRLLTHQSLSNFLKTYYESKNREDKLSSVK